MSFGMMLALSVLAGQPVSAQRSAPVKVTVALKGVSLSDALRQIQRKSGTKILFVVDDVKGYTVTADLRGLSAAQAVARVLEGKPFTYTVRGGFISVARRSTTTKSPAQQHQGSQEKETLRRVTGVVTDAQGEPLIGATVNVPGSPFGTVTDVDGKYEFYVPTDCHEVQVSYVGMKSAMMTLGRKETNNFILQEDKSMLNEVVVTGYQTLSKERTTGAFAKVTGADLQDKRFSNLSSLLEGEVAGYNTESNLIRGVTTMNGVAAPLYVVDGFPVENTNYDNYGSLNEAVPNLNIDDIESVTVLKDASAASIYGARAANGVIVITTKKARKDKKADVSFSTNLTWHPYSYDYKRLTDAADIVSLEKQWAADNPNLQGDGAAEYAQSLLDNNVYQSQGIRSILNYYAGHSSADQMQATLSALASKGYKYYKDVEKYAKRTAFYQQYHLSVGKASDSNNFMASLSYRNNKLNDKYNNDNSWTLDLKDQFDIAPWLHLTVGNYAYMQRSQAQTFDPLSTAYTYESYDGLKNDDGTNTTYTQEDRLTQSSLSILNDYGLYNLDITPLDEIGRNLDKTKNFTDRVYGKLDVDIFSWLKYNVMFQYEYSTMRERLLYDKDSYYVRSLVDQYATDNGNGGTTYNIPYGNILFRANQDRKAYVFRQQLNFDRTFAKKHNVVALLGHEVRRTLIDYDNSTLYNYDDDMLSYSLINQSELSSIAGLMGGYGLSERDFAYLRNIDNRYISFYGNAAYTYDDRYVATASIRWDRSNLWGTNSKYQNKPIWSTGLAWNMDRESWMKVSWIDRLKLRLSYGIAGNVAKDAAPYMTASYYNNENVGGQYGSISSRPNPDLRWEKTTTTDLGIDFSLFRGRLYGTVDYYNKQGSDLLANTMGVPTEGWGYSTYMVNNGKMRNRGVEITLGGDIVRQGDFRLDATATYSYNKNTVTYVNVTAPVYYLQLDYPQAYPVIGNSYYGLYAYEFAGLSEDGLPQVYDADGNAVTSNPGDLNAIKYYGTTSPTTLGSIKLGAHYKGLSLSVLATYMGGYKARNTDMPMLQNAYNSASYNYVASITPVNKDIMNAWTPTNTTSSVPRVIFGESDLYTYDSRNIYYYSSANIVNMSHWKLTNISLAYTLPAHISRQAHLSNVRLQFDMENVATLAHSKAARYMLSGYEAPNYVFGLYLDL
ncbi:MAG: SusC/RagA family TonB-linked outer membrane protein [Prevotella sp.]